jgi:hypothetical protein
MEGGGSGRAMRSWRRNLNEGKLRVHEGSRSLDRSELGKTEALGLPCEDGEESDKGEKGKGNRQRICPEKDASDGQVPVDLSRIIVTVSTVQP